MMSQNKLQDYYKNVLLYHLALKMPVKNVMEIPRLEKIVINIGFPNIVQDKKLILSGLFALEVIANQKAYATQSKKQVLNLKINKNTFVGSACTLRQKEMFVFLNDMIQYVFQNENILSDISYHILPQDRCITLSLYDLSYFTKFEKELHLFRQIQKLNVTIVFTSNQSFLAFQNLMTFLLKALKIPENSDERFG